MLLSKLIDQLMVNNNKPILILAKRITVDYNGKFIKDGGLSKVMNDLYSVNNRDKVEELNLYFQMSFFSNLNIILSTIERFSNLKSCN
jgi:hypothetical protein